MKIKRLEEEKSSLKRQCERAKRMEKFENIDELIKEENRLYKVIIFRNRLSRKKYLLENPKNILRNVKLCKDIL